MKLVIAGAWTRAVYEQAWSDALVRAGAQVARFSWANYSASWVGKAEEKWALPGPCTVSLNRTLVQFVAAESPDAVLVWKGTRLWPASLKRMRSTGALLASYNHDDFSGPLHGAAVPRHHHRMWRPFLACAPHYDLHLVKRADNIEHLESLGAPKSVLCPMYFVPEAHRPVELSPEDQRRYQCDAVFVGHYEPDGRDECLRALVEAGVHVRLFGNSWTAQTLGDLAGHFGDVRTVYGDEYAKALCGAKLCLCFLSKINRDTYTRRCMEIPACGRLLVCERSADLERLFVEDEEAVLFSSPAELVEKTQSLLSDPERIERMARAGRERVDRDGHSVDARVGQFLELLRECRQSERRVGQRLKRPN